MIFASACFAAYVWATYWVPETANVPLEDIDTLFGSTAGKEDLRIKHQARIALLLKVLPRFVTHAVVRAVFSDTDRA